MIARYSIEANDEIVVIYGHLRIEEAFDFLNYYEKEGFNCVSFGKENSTICLLKHDHKNDTQNCNDTKDYENISLEAFKQENTRLQRINKELTDLINKLLHKENPDGMATPNAI